jgi:hypothetical protein
MSQPAKPEIAATEQHHYEALAEIVINISKDHAQLRLFVYEFARTKLRKELYPQFVEGAWPEIEEQLRGLEIAINRIESQFEPALPSPAHLELAHTNGPPSNGLMIRPPNTSNFDAQSLSALSLYPSAPAPFVSDDPVPNSAVGKHARSSFWWNVEVIAAVAIGLGIYTSVEPETVLALLGINAPWSITTRPNVPTRDVTAIVKAATTRPERSAKPYFNGIPIPTEYGVYAIVNDSLAELDQLPLKVPDPRVAISAISSVPSRTHLPDGNVKFVVFRRDFATSAPDRVSARVVAQVVRVLAFDSAGHARTTEVDDAWVIRSKEYHMRLGPFGDNPEMVLIRPDADDFVYPAGRYVLVLKGVGYDFTVDGQVTDTAHCLERTVALNAPVYTECRKL